MKNKAIKYNHWRDDMKANIIRYWIEDMLDNLSNGYKIDLDKFEKRVLKIIKASTEDEIRMA
jgi:hypothetical protein